MCRLFSIHSLSPLRYLHTVKQVDKEPPENCPEITQLSSIVQDNVKFQAAVVKCQNLIENLL